MKNLIQDLLRTNFFQNPGRTIDVTEENFQENDYMFHVLYDDVNSVKVINSLMILRGAYRKDSKVPGYAMVTTENAIVNYDVDAAQIVITLAADGDKEGTVVTLDSTVGEDAFFQESLVTDLRGITYDFIEFVREAVKLSEKYELESTATATADE